YSRAWLGVVVGGEVDAGRDVFGGNFTRIAGFIRYDEDTHSPLTDSIPDDSGDAERPVFDSGELFVDLGANANRVNIDLTSATTRTTGPFAYSGHLAVGVRRFVSDKSDLGVRVESNK